MIELACPESCSYLIEARVTAGRRENQLRLKEASTLDPRSLMLNDHALLALERIESTIINFQRGVEGESHKDLDNGEVHEALENAIKNLETQESGLIYEHDAATRRTAELSRRIRARLDGMDRELPPEARPRRSDILKALEFARDAAKAHAARATGGKEGSRSYIRYVALFYPWPETATKPLIL